MAVINPVCPECGECNLVINNGYTKEGFIDFPVVNLGIPSATIKCNDCGYETCENTVSKVIDEWNELMEDKVIKSIDDLTYDQYLAMHGNCYSCRNDHDNPMVQPCSTCQFSDYYQFGLPRQDNWNPKIQSERTKWK